MGVRAFSTVVLLGIACSTAAPHQRAQEPVQQQDDTERRIALLNQPAPPVEEIRRSLDEYLSNIGTGRPPFLLRHLALQACGRVQDRNCVSTLGALAKHDAVSDVQSIGMLSIQERADILDALVARCASGGREVLAAVVSDRAGLVTHDAPPKEAQAQKPVDTAPTGRRNKAHKKSADKASPAPAAPTDAALVQAVAACPSADSVFLLVNAGYGDLEALLASTKVPPGHDPEDRRHALTAMAALPPPSELTRAALAEAEAKAEARRREGEAHLAAGREALASGDLDKAAMEANAAESLGVAAVDLKSATAAARDAEYRHHVQKARALVKKNDPDGAMAEVEKAEAVAGGSGSLAELREAIARTPTALRRGRIRQAEERSAEQKRIREARAAARSDALRTLCDLGAEQQRDVQEISMEQSGACGGSGMSPGAFQCNNQYESAKMRVMSRYEARMARFRAHAERQLGRALTQRDCCAALPSRYQFYGDNCIQYR
jgi:hypothetical protein